MTKTWKPDYKELLPHVKKSNVLATVALLCLPKLRYIKI